ncbi:hypothetical protein TNCV_751731 [Trichonephila clavipes]|uniref:Uncharacterized protein n=1 Tax=Trichonephila clavipes TaxID=2585209 RepID=A0A8X6WAN1_TRICX|nr:hypothetical protein TNCV_751731 [Trichonephila clavipes]
MTVPVVQFVNGLCNAPLIVWVSVAIDLREYHCSMLTSYLGKRAEYRGLEMSSMDDESRFQLLNLNGRLRIWRQAHEAMDSTCQVETVQSMVSRSWAGVFIRGIVWDLFFVYQPPSMQFGT